MTVPVLPRERDQWDVFQLLLEPTSIYSGILLPSWETYFREEAACFGVCSYS